jgi:Fe-S-cluster containining protein
MDFDFQPYFNRYELLAKAANRVFEQVQSQFPKEIECRLECSDCCHAVFDVTLIEALYLNYQFCKYFTGKDREAILDKANRADRQAYKLKRAAFQKVEEGKDESEILIEMAGERIRCPLLNAQNRCDLYEYRPVTCRFYGVPTEIAGIAHTCGKSGFIKGKSYPTVHLEKMQKNLFALSFEIARDIQSKFAGLGEILVPISMALLTDYDEDYLGIKRPEMSEKEGMENGKRSDKDPIF